MKVTTTVIHTTKKEARKPVAYKSLSGSVHVLGSLDGGGGVFYGDGAFQRCAYVADLFANTENYTPIYPGDSVDFVKTVTF